MLGCIIGGEECPASEPQWASRDQRFPGWSSRKAGLPWGKVWELPLSCLALGGPQVHGPACVCRTLLPGCERAACGGKRGRRREGVDNQILEPAPVVQSAPTRHGNRLSHFSLSDGCHYGVLLQLLRSTKTLETQTSWELGQSKQQMGNSAVWLEASCLPSLGHPEIGSLASQVPVLLPQGISRLALQQRHN